jgi:hypothetical protein
VLKISNLDLIGPGSSAHLYFEPTGAPLAQLTIEEPVYAGEGVNGRFRRISL